MVAAAMKTYTTPTGWHNGSDQTSSEATMTAIHRDYLPERKEPAFPRDLAAAIARKAHRMAEQLEEQAISQMVMAARRSLRDGFEPGEVARQLGL